MARRKREESDLEEMRRDADALGEALGLSDANGLKQTPKKIGASKPVPVRSPKTGRTARVRKGE